jgi:dienelactone hydrolase
MRWINALTLVLASTPVAAAGFETVQISATGDSALRAILYKPAGNGPFPVIVALHGCSGLGNRSEPIQPRYQEWGERLSAAGFAVLFPDSLGSRGIRSQCRAQEAKVRAAHERVADANAARLWLQQQSWAAPERISLLGWSSGAVSLLWAIRPQGARAQSGTDFRAAVALYPGCRRLRNTAWSARLPTLVLIGAADDWALARDCEQMVRGARGRSAGASIVVYPGAYHEFDRANRPLRELKGLAYSADGSGRAHVGTNPVARADAFKRVPEWLAR